MQKFHRIYRATFEIGKSKKGEAGRRELVVDKVITIENPISLNLHIDLRMTGGQPNSGLFQFLNLSPQVQADLWKDKFTNVTKIIFMTLEAGYGYTDDKDGKFAMPVIFKGIVQICTSHKESGGVDWITNVQAIEGGLCYQYGFINTTFTQGTKFDDIANYILENDKETKPGYISPDIKPLPRNKTFIGQTMDILGREYGGYDVFIDKGKLNILGENDVLPGDLLVLTDKSGLLGTPRRGESFVEVDLLFEPQIRLGQAVEILSDLMPQFNMAYKVQSISHDGLISERQGQSLITRLVLTSVIKKNLRELKPAAPKTYNKSADTTWAKPVSKGRITDRYGWRIHPITKQKSFHEGMDIGTDFNIPIYAPANGTVTFRGWNGGYGRTVKLDNGTINSVHITSLYAHMNQWNVQLGQTVVKGQTVLGFVGSTGSSTGPHLHIEIRENGSTVNPTKYIGSY